MFLHCNMGWHLLFLHTPVSKTDPLLFLLSFFKSFICKRAANTAALTHYFIKYRDTQLIIGQFIEHIETFLLHFQQFGKSHSIHFIKVCTPCVICDSVFYDLSLYLISIFYHRNNFIGSRKRAVAEEPKGAGIINLPLYVKIPLFPTAFSQHIPVPVPLPNMHRSCSAYPIHRHESADRPRNGKKNPMPHPVKVPAV